MNLYNCNVNIYNVTCGKCSHKSYFIPNNNSQSNYKNIISILKKDGMYIKYIPEPTSDMCEIAAQQNGNSLEFISEHMQSEKVCILALIQNYRSFKYIKKGKVTDYLISIRNIYKLKQETKKLNY